MLLSYCVVNTNGRDWLLACLEAIERTGFVFARYCRRARALGLRLRGRREQHEQHDQHDDAHADAEPHRDRLLALHRASSNSSRHAAASVT